MSTYLYPYWFFVKSETKVVLLKFWNLFSVAWCHCNYIIDKKYRSEVSRWESIRSSRPEVFIKIVALKFSRKFQQNVCGYVFFWIKVTGWNPRTLLKTSTTDALLGTFSKLKEQLFSFIIIPPDGCHRSMLFH